MVAFHLQFNVVFMSQRAQCAFKPSVHGNHQRIDQFNNNRNSWHDELWTLSLHQSMISASYDFTDRPFGRGGSKIRKRSANKPKEIQQSSFTCRCHCVLLIEELLPGQCSLNALCSAFPGDGVRGRSTLTDEWCYRYFCRTLVSRDKPSLYCSHAVL